ncbi:MAG: hypothetical protein FWF29_06515, partial [Treponema sp.]|nr:hypothetical protein [Treponema sp.]
VFGKATLDLHGKTGFRTVFPKPFPKLTEFWKWLNRQIFSGITTCLLRHKHVLQDIKMSPET